MNDELKPTEEGISWAERSSTLSKLAPALAKAQGQISTVKKDSNNPFFKSKYANLASVRVATKEALESNGLSIIQEPGMRDNRATMTTTILHCSGEFIRSCLELPIVKQDPQGVGSALTYARRYALMAILGIASEDDDDDGNAASFNECKAALSKPTKPELKGGIVGPISKLAPADDMPEWLAEHIPSGTEFIYDITSADEPNKNKALAILKGAKARRGESEDVFLVTKEIPALERYKTGYIEAQQ